MKNSRQTEIAIYRLCDWLMAIMAWLIFFVYRKKIEQPSVTLTEALSDEKLHLGLLIIPLCWIILYSLFDKYTDIYRYSRLGTLRRTFILSLVGTLFLFFTVMVDDTTLAHSTYLLPFVVLFALHFLLTSFSRLSLLTWAKQRLRAGKVSYRTIMVGGGADAAELYALMDENAKIVGYDFMGFVDSSAGSSSELSRRLKYLGDVSQLNAIIIDNNIEEVIISKDKSQKWDLKYVLDQLYDLRDKVLVKVSSDLYDVMLGKVKMSHIYDAALIEIDQELMSRSTRLMKRGMDVFFAMVLIIICLPLFVFLAIKVRLSSPGPLLYSQERIGKDGVPFHILKFRSMYTDAEKKGPQLSSDHDPRITPFGRIMRKWRLDEIPQFFNLLKGDMSLVGPRPERQYFIDKIVGVEPLYRHLLKVRPGITSWGQVKFGYASNVEEMVKRLKYDLIYLENMSLTLDLKILFYTAIILYQGRGK